VSDRLIQSTSASEHRNTESRNKASSCRPSFAFIGWNSFQIIHILDIAQKLKNSCIVIEKRRSNIAKFEDDLLTKTGIPVVFFSKKQIERLDGLFDVIICQTPFSQMEKIKKSRIAMIQYGYAKAEHNFGKWRAAANLCMVYGEYAASQIRSMCPVSITGNPAFDKWYDPTFHKAAQEKYEARLDPLKKTILYAPTWGDISTSHIYLNEVLSLTDEYNLVLKIHHNTDFLEKRKRALMMIHSPIALGANTSLLELIAISDLVLSDYSGAIFDALHCKRPVILLQNPIPKRISDKIDLHSLEHSARHQIGPVIETTGVLKETIRNVISGNIDFSSANHDLDQKLYLEGASATERVINSLIGLALSK
jgi:hypothetical protein